jgi:hypothetical protein
MEIFINLLLGVGTSLLASFLFLYYILTRMRPKIKISPHIAHYKDLNNQNKKIYYFKIVNKSWHAAYDLRFRVCELSRIPAENRKFHERREDLKLRREYLTHIPKHKKIGENDVAAPHALIITCLDDLHPILEDDNKCVELQVIMRHGLTGLAKVFSYEYSSYTCVKNGIFDFGDKLTISSPPS